MSTSDPDLVFLSYSHADREWMRRLMILLTPVVRNRRLDVWADEHILVGEEWQRDIRSAVSRARLAICLVSADFLASRFIMEEELPALRAAGVCVAPVLVHECLWQEDPYLASVQWVHDPGREGPLDLRNEHPGERDRRLTAVCRRVLELLPPVAVAVSGDGAGQVWAGDVVALRTGTRGPGPVDGVPILPPGYLARDELDGLRAAVLDDRSAAVGVTGRVSGLGLVGQGGIGKTVLATALSRDAEVRRCFPDGVFWVTLGEAADPLAAQLDLLDRLDVTETDVRSVVHGARVLREALAQRQCLLIVDDVWTTAAAKALAVTGPRGRVLYTTRDASVLDAVGAHIEHVDVLSEDLARRLLAQLSGTKIEESPAEVDRVLTGTGRVALALALVGAAVHGGSSWAQVAAELDRGERVFGTHPYANTFKALQLATASMDDSDTELYLSLAVFPPDTRIPLPAICRYWQRLRGDTPAQTHARLRSFADRQLLTLDLDAGQIGFHDLQHDYLLLQVDDLDLLHTDLLAAHHDLLPRNGQWWQLPADEAYLWHHLIHHLHGAGNNVELSNTVTDPAYLITRSFRHGPQTAEADLRHTQTHHPRADHEWWQRWFGHYGHLLADLPTLPDTAATAALRLTDTPHRGPTRSLDALQSPPYLTPRWGLTPAPQNLRRTLTDHDDAVTSVAFSPDGELLASASNDGTVRIWDTATGTAHTALTCHGSGVTSVTFSPDGELLASGDDDGAVRIWQSATGTARTVLTGHGSQVTSVSFSPDGELLASASDDRTVRIWHTATGTARAVLTGHEALVCAVTFSPDGALLASASDDRTVRTWHTATGTGHTVLSAHQGWVCSVAFSPDGELLASASVDRTVRIWQTPTGTEPAVRTGHKDEVNAVAFSSDGALLASASRDGTARIWQTATGTERAVLTGHKGEVNAVAFSPDGTLLASASSWDRTVQIWQTATGTERTVLTGHGDSVRSVTFSPDGELLASGSRDGTVGIWQTATGTERAVLTGHKRGVSSVAFSPDGELLASGSWDGTARIWETATGLARTILTAHQGGVSSVAFSPDGELLASAGSAGTVQIWDHTTVTRTVQLGLKVLGLSWHGDLLGVAVDRCAVVLRITRTPA